MKHKIMMLGVLTSPFIFTACQTTDEWFSADTQGGQPSLQMVQQQEKTIQSEAFAGHKDAQLLNHWARDPHQYLTQYHNNIASDGNLKISDYVESLAIKLVKNMRYVTDKTPIAVASFVPVDSNLEETNLLGLHLAENFMHEAQQLGLSVIDYKSTGTIRVTETGDFSLSRDIDELRQWHPIEYVLTGTFTLNDRGIEVHARVVGIESRAVVASAQGFIPHSATQQLKQYNKKDGISLTKG
ncbi:FlgO family outer membrane protein [Algibacillus agarilyticus]|uniref:FlgO family outer membrane protein n=1 Tax=Algibacillus agarilyticus TaxID=2234133 RepID=UPI000DCF77D9|nr:FlgO family outer membrane protein [Algibacillus agarilyticus]